MNFRFDLAHEDVGPFEQKQAEMVALAETVVRAERALARQAARLSGSSRIIAARYADVLAVLALLLAWSVEGSGQATVVRNGLQSSGWVASLALMSVVVRQIVLAAVAAQPDRRAVLTLTVTGTVTGSASILALVRLPALSVAQGVPHFLLTGPLSYGVVSGTAAMLTVFVGRSMSGPAIAPDLLSGLRLAAVDDIQVRIDAAELAIRQRTADPLPAAGVLGLVVAVAGAQATWADPFGLRWLLGAAMGVVMLLAVLRVRRAILARVQVVAGAVCVLLVLRAVLMVTSYASASGAWLSLAGSIVTVLSGVAVLLGRYARRLRVS